MAASITGPGSPLVPWNQLIVDTYTSLGGGEEGDDSLTIITLRVTPQSPATPWPSIKTAGIEKSNSLISPVYSKGCTQHPIPKKVAAC